MQRVALLTTGDLTLQAGTPSAFKLGTEEDPWCADEITVCAQGVCTICHKNPCECSGGKRDDPDVTWPDPKDDTGGSSGGGGGSTGSTDSSDPKELMNVNYFVTYGLSGDCMEGCRQILAKYGIRNPVTSSIILITEGKFGQLDVHAGRYPLGISTLNRHLNAGRPVIVGVSSSWGVGTGNLNAATDHFVVITGRGIDADNGMYYYTYMETGTSDVNDGCNTDNNRFYLDPFTPSFTDNSGMLGTGTYQVTEIRGNDGK